MAVACDLQPRVRPVGLYDAAFARAPAFRTIMGSSPPAQRAYLVEIFLPLQDKAGRPQPAELFAQVRETLTETFGGITTYSRAPAEGRWDNGHRVERDDIVVFEAMTPALDPHWWASYRQQLERQFSQDQILIRASELRLL